MADPIMDNQPKPNESAVNLRSSLKDESLRTSKSLEKFNDVDSLGKSYVELEGKLGRSVELPKDESDEEGWGRLRSRLGPKAAEEYELSSIKDEGLRKSLAEKAFSVGAPKRHLKAVADAIGEYEKRAEEARKASRDKQIADAEGKLKAKYGEKLEETHEKALKAFSKMFSSRQALYERMKAVGLDNDPDMVDTFAEFYSVIAPDDNPIVGDKGSKKVSSEDNLDWMYKKYGGSPTPGKT